VISIGCLHNIPDPSYHFKHTFLNQVHSPIPPSPLPQAQILFLCAFEIIFPRLTCSLKCRVDNMHPPLKFDEGKTFKCHLFSRFVSYDWPYHILFQRAFEIKSVLRCVQSNWPPSSESYQVVSWNRATDFGLCKWHRGFHPLNRIKSYHGMEQLAVGFVNGIAASILGIVSHRIMESNNWL
jgi:hypothetical protein